MRTHTPLVSIIIPAHNAESFIQSAVESILSQTYSNFELIIIDDGSTDNTYSLIQQLSQIDTRIQCIHLTKNKGESAAANIGFRASSGIYIARMDADDLSDPTRIEKQVLFLEANQEYVVVGSQAHIIDENNSILGEKRFPTEHDAIYSQYGILHPMLHPSLMVRKSLLPNTHKLWAEQAEPNDDYFTFFELLQYGKFHNLSEKLLFYRMHSSNKSMQNVKKKFLNSVRIRVHAVKYFNYPVSFEMMIHTCIQATIVLAFPEWFTIGLFMWVKNIKPFHLAFPFFSNMKSKYAELLAHYIPEKNLV